MDDTLDLEKMKYYVVQDALYLKHFAGCLRMIGKSKRVDTARFESFATGCEHAEMDLQNRFFSVWAIDPNVKPEPNTLLYIRCDTVQRAACHATRNISCKHTVNQEPCNIPCNMRHTMQHTLSQEAF